MLFAQISDLAITAIFAGIAGLIVVAVPAYIALKKAWAEAALKADEAEQLAEERDAALAKTTRNGVIGDLEKALERCGSRNDSADNEIAELRVQVTRLYSLIAAKDTRVEKQAAQVEQLQTAVTLAKDAGPAVALPAGTEVKIPESTMRETPEQKKE